VRIRLVFATLFGVIGIALIAMGVAVTFWDMKPIAEKSFPTAKFVQHAATNEGGSMAIAGSICLLAAAVLVRAKHTE
jgi:hypothetical protein